MGTTRDRLIGVAMRLFAETGTRTVTVAQLARSAALARGTVYSHFPDFDNLFEIVSREIAEQLNAEVKARWENISLPHERIALFMAVMLKRAHDDPHFGHFMVRFAPSTPSLYRAWSDFLPKALKSCVDQGIMEPFDNGIAYYVQLMAGATYSFTMLIVEGRATWRDASANLISLCLTAGGIARTDAVRVAELTVSRIGGDAGAVLLS